MPGFSMPPAFQFPMNSSYCPGGLGHTHTHSLQGKQMWDRPRETLEERPVGKVGPGTPGDPCLTPDSGLAVVIILSALLLGCWGILPMPGA